MTDKVFEIYLVSDATGNTLKTLTASCLSQFENIEVNINGFPLTSNDEKIDIVLSSLEKKPGLVLFTLPRESLKERLEKFCLAKDIPCFDMLATPLKVLSAFFEVDSREKPGAQYSYDDNVINKIVAIEYALKFDTPNPSFSDLDQADVILVGPSRTSKKPISIYLASHEIKVASITLYPDKELPEEIFNLKGKLIIGLKARPDLLVNFRRHRLKIFDPFMQPEYLNEDLVEEEIMLAKKLYKENSWPVIDITNKSLEEICEDIIEKLNNTTQELK